jgi:hypothetical protein
MGKALSGRGCTDDEEQRKEQTALTIGTAQCVKIRKFCPKLFHRRLFDVTLQPFFRINHNR